MGEPKGRKRRLKQKPEMLKKKKPHLGWERTETMRPRTPKPMTKKSKGAPRGPGDQREAIRREGDCWELKKPWGVE